MATQASYVLPESPNNHGVEAVNGGQDGVGLQIRLRGWSLRLLGDNLGGQGVVC
jgi:hypothetical protein